MKSENFLILISAGGEWEAIRKLFPNETYQPSPYGEYFSTGLDSPAFSQPTDKMGVEGESGEGWSEAAGIKSAEYSGDPGYNG